MRSSALRALTAVLICAMAGAGLRAQTAGHIRGTVVNDDDKPLADVQVEAMHQSSKRTTKTSKDGQFRFSMVPPGNYRVKFTLAGFSEVEKNATVRLDGTVTVDAKLFRLTTSASR